jgi:hypothetical protein
MVERISSNYQHLVSFWNLEIVIIPAGRTGFVLIICVSRRGASTDCRCSPPVTVVLLKADMID